MPIKTSAGKELNSSATAFVYTYPGSTKGRWNGNDQWFELDTYARDTKWATMKIRMITDDKDVPFSILQTETGRHIARQTQQAIMRAGEELSEDSPKRYS